MAEHFFPAATAKQAHPGRTAEDGCSPYTLPRQSITPGGHADEGGAAHPLLGRKLRALSGASSRHLVLAANNGAAAGPGLNARPDVSSGWRLGKRAIDFCGALLLLLVFSPLMLVVTGLIAVSGGNVLFRQQRIGRHGRLFGLYKFRTMVPDAEAALEAMLHGHPELRAEWERNQKLREDPRITRIGALLRRTSIDELPQLLNVLRGEMSLVGPRPVLAAELERYGRAAQWYRAVKPGITGLWQVSGRNETGYTRRIALDMHYVRSQSLWLDVMILCRTVFVVLFRIGAH